MIDREKIIKAVEEAFDMYWSEYGGTSYFDAKEWAENKRDALALLKEQEAVEPKVIRTNSFGDPVHACGKCGVLITESMNYCCECGRKVKWE